MKDFDEKGKPEILKKSPKTGDRFRTTSDLQNNEENALFHTGITLGIESSFRSFQRKFKVPRYLRIGTKCSL